MKKNTVELCIRALEIMMNEPENYKNLKKRVLEKAGENYDLEEIKMYFENDINSPRALSNVKSLEDLIEILEERDILSYQCPLPLFYIGRDILKNEKISGLVTVYKKYLLEEKHTSCCCGEKVTYSPPTELLQCDGSFPIHTESDILKAITVVSSKIGEHWRVLASELDIKESQIDYIYKKHPEDLKNQAHEALMLWVQNDKENATIKTLDKALNARLCKRFGLGTHLRIPLAGVN